MPHRMSFADPPRLLCDEMLQGLGRWLRAAGYDTAIELSGCSDARLLERALEEQRILVTRDRKLIEHRAARERVVLLQANSLADCAQEVAQHLGIDWCFQPFSRCLLCNQLLRQASPEQMAQIPSESRARVSEALACPECNKVYWDGSHVLRMRRQLEGWSRRTRPGGRA